MPRTSSIESDPLRNFRFRVALGIPVRSGPLEMGFTTVSGLDSAIDVFEYNEGGDNTSPRKFPNRAQWAPVRLARGILPVGGIQRQDLFAWFRSAFVGANSKARFRATSFLISVLDHPASGNGDPATKLELKFYHPWCSGISLGDLDASSNGILIETMTVHHEGFIPNFNL